MLTQPKNLIISDVELNWARLDTPAANPFGGEPNWELQIATTDAAKAADWKANDLNVKESEGNFTVSLRRKSVTKDGAAMEPVRVVDAQKLPIAAADRRKIGNGSRGNVIVWLAPYEYAGRKGVTSSLTAVQVTHLEEYSGGGDNVDFDMVGEAPAAEAANADMF
jgi:hypothetical protein